MKHFIFPRNRQRVCEKTSISVMLPDKPKQITSLIPSSENGLFSRIMFYIMNTKYEWLDVFANIESGALEDYFKGLGDTFYEYYKYLKATLLICLRLPLGQQQEFNHLSPVHDFYGT